MRISRSLVLALAVSLSGTADAADEKAENPSFKQWDRFGEGTSVVMRRVSEDDGAKTEMEVTTTVIERKADKIVLETKGSVTIGGKKRQLLAQRMDVPARGKAAAGDGGAWVELKAETKEAGTEKVTVGDRTITCKVTTATDDGVAITTKQWTSDEVPGGVVKSETTVGGATKSVTTVEVVKMDVKTPAR